MGFIEKGGREGGIPLHSKAIPYFLLSPLCQCPFSVFLSNQFLFLLSLQVNSPIFPFLSPLQANPHSFSISISLRPAITAVRPRTSPSIHPLNQAQSFSWLYVLLLLGPAPLLVFPTTTVRLELLPAFPDIMASLGVFCSSWNFPQTWSGGHPSL